VLQQLCKHCINTKHVNCTFSAKPCLSQSSSSTHHPPMATPASLTREISPPPTPRKRTSQARPADAVEAPNGPQRSAAGPSLAAIEAGQAKIQDHLAYFSAHLREASRPSLPATPRLSINDFVRLYQRSESPRGRHFVIHQHNHPIAGVHCMNPLLVCSDEAEQRLIVCR